MGSEGWDTWSVTDLCLANFAVDECIEGGMALSDDDLLMTARLLST